MGIGAISINLGLEAICTTNIACNARREILFSVNNPGCLVVAKICPQVSDIRYYLSWEQSLLSSRLDLCAGQ